MFAFSIVHWLIVLLVIGGAVAAIVALSRR
jgi:hypothetical protein